MKIFKMRSRPPNRIWFFSLAILSLLTQFADAQFLPDPPDSETYRKAALDLLLREANQVASALQLPEKLPITEQDLRGKFICSPKIACNIQAIGTVTTSNYVYCVSRDNKLSYVIDPHQEEKLRVWEKSYSWLTNRQEKIGPYLLATQWLRQASMDVDALNRDCLLVIQPEWIYGREDRFIPAYSVRWINGQPDDASVASVRLFLPTKTLMQLRVEDPKYILRPPLASTNPADWISPTNALYRLRP